MSQSAHEQQAPQHCSGTSAAGEDQQAPPGIANTENEGLHVLAALPSPAHE